MSDEDSDGFEVAEYESSSSGSSEEEAEIVDHEENSGSGESKSGSSSSSSSSDESSEDEKSGEEGGGFGHLGGKHGKSEKKKKGHGAFGFSMLGKALKKVSEGEHGKDKEHETSADQHGASGFAAGGSGLAPEAVAATGGPAFNDHHTHIGGYGAVDHHSLSSFPPPPPSPNMSGNNQQQYSGAPTMQTVIPPQGRRFQTTTTAQFPGSDIVGVPPFGDYGGHPIYVGSAVMQEGRSVHPCKLGPHLDPPARVPYGGAELGHNGRYDLLPITEAMEWVPTSHGRIPEGRRPIDGGFEEGGERLYHGLVVMENQFSVPGKTGTHLGACHVAWGGAEQVHQENYYILCWR